MPWVKENGGVLGIALFASYCLQQTGLCDCVQWLVWGYGLCISFRIWSDKAEESSLLLFEPAFVCRIDACKCWGKDLACIWQGQDRCLTASDRGRSLHNPFCGQRPALASGIQLSPSPSSVAHVMGRQTALLLSGSELWLWCLGTKCPCSEVVGLCLLTLGLLELGRSKKPWKQG